MEKRGICLSSTKIKEWIKNGKIIGPSIEEKQIQPNSFEPTINNEVFILDTESQGLFRPQKEKSIYKTLLEIPERQRYRVDITNGFEIKKGFTYLFPTRERIIMHKKEYIKSSTKSSIGRLFLNCRMLADYNPCFDEINAQYKSETELNVWLLVQPLTFNLIVYPGLTFNQLRFFQGHDSQLTPSEIMSEFQKNPLLYWRGNNGTLLPAEPFVTDGLQIHLDLSGNNSKGVIALRARHNPNPINLQKIGEYEVEHYFEPTFRDDKPLRLLKGEHYLFASKEILKFPSHLSGEVKAYSHVGLSGPVHFAGFIDSGFHGDLVFEIRSDEISGMTLEDGMPASKIDVFRNDLPDKIYGIEIGSHYQGQIGPRPSKFFKLGWG
ncbi:2'-deoxycytidine 5'-triphosphate deaminase [Candidatus Woesearchaeota archaeon]|nr:2'-deoxycytidine 5'-triphosphate deaminase [Candidatus Woesearchaeota archaeon]